MRPALSVLLALSTITATPALADETSRKEVAEAVAGTVQSAYVFPEKGAEAARLVRQRAASGDYDKAADNKAFVETLTADLYSVTKDKHLVVRWNAAGYPPMAAGAPSPATELRDAQRSNFSTPRVEVLAGNIGYIKIDQFHGPDEAKATIAAAMSFVANTDALIFDLRDNRGGDSATVALAISYLAPPQTHLVSFRNRGATKEEQSWTLPDVPGGRWSLTKPVYVLTSGKTFSAGEEFAYDLQQLKRATIVGARSRGGANPGVITPISQHYRMFVPNEAAVNPISGTNWEGIGVAPDVAVVAEQSLATAHKLALETLLAKADSDEKAELEEVLAGLGN